MIIICNFTGNPGSLNYMGHIIKENVNHCKSMQVCFIFNLFRL